MRRWKVESAAPMEFLIFTTETQRKKRIQNTEYRRQKTECRIAFRLRCAMTRQGGGGVLNKPRGQQSCPPY